MGAACEMRQRITLLDTPEADELETHLALINWALWCRSKWAPQRAYSAEGRYVPPATNIFTPQEPGVAVDERSAVEVNASLVLVPQQHRQALRLRYYDRAPDRIIARRLAIHAGSYQRFLRDARLMLRNIMRFRAR